jgi:hypothetical protein
MMVYSSVQESFRSVEHIREIYSEQVMTVCECRLPTEKYGMIEPHRVADDFSWIAISMIG